MIWRILVLLHRYLGVTSGALMLIWFATGIVMLYVPYPSLSGKARVGMLEPIDWRACCRSAAGAIAADEPVERAEVESVSGILALRLTRPGRPATLFSLEPSATAVPLDLPHARITAVAAARQSAVVPSEPTTVETIDQDQWTVSGEYNTDRPLFRFGFDDRDRTRIYVSSHSGRVVLRTSQRQRFWNWLGAIPHWLYPTILRSHVRLWTQVVIWASLVGLFLTMLGLCLGIVQYRARGRRLLSPYAGIWNWHHSLGLVFGFFTLTWVGSGLVSMNPWGFLNGGAGVSPAPKLRSVTWGELDASLTDLAASPAVSNIVTLRMVPLSGDLFWIATLHDGTRVRLDARGQLHPMTPAELRIAAQRAGGSPGISAMTLLQREDAYYYRRHEPVELPVLRVIANDADHTRLYLDPASGEVLGQLDADGRRQRWLFDGLHRLDFLPSLRASVIWSALVLFLLTGGGALAATGTYLAVRRVFANVA